MGCGSSKVDDLPLVALCRERKDLIRAAADHRFSLASAHASYFQALNGIGDALHRFVQEELTVVPTPSSSSSASSPVLTVPSSEGKPQKSKSRSVAASGGDAGGGASSSSPVSLSYSLSPEGSHLHFSSGSDSDESREGGGGEPSSSSHPHPPLSAVPSPNYYYMRHSSAIPAMVYEAPYPGYGYPPPEGGNEGYFGGNEGYFGVPMDSPSASGDGSSYYYYDRPMSSTIPDTTPPPPPPPPPPEGSTWDFLNPFGSYEQNYSRYRVGSVASSPNSSEVREQEGIPDLEEETEQEPVKEVRKEKKMEDGDSREKDSGTTSSKSAPLHEKDVTESSVEKQSKSSPEGSNSKSSGAASNLISSGEEEYARKKGVSFEVETSLASEKSRPSLETAFSTQGTRDVTEVVEEIKGQFKLAADSGGEVSAMLEVGKMRYRSRNAVFRVISSRILDSLPMSAYSHPSLNHAHRSTASTSKMAKVNRGDFGNSIGMKSGNLSSTLEKLCVWEKKLYKEVKDEEKLRVIYEKQCKRLKFLDDRGAESYKIDATQASIRKLLTKIDIVVKSVDAISSRIHKLRDEELQPQLTELVQGLIKMWKSVLDCHQKQFLAIVESKSHNLLAKTNIQRDSVAKATIELELELLNWSSCFNDWISTQKAYFETLNGWLRKCLYVEPEETPDGVPPFSPGRIGAPAVFIICNDWYEAMKKISEDKVTTAVHAFATSVHELWKSQGAEQQQKLKAEYLSKDLARRLKSLQKEAGIHGLQEAFDKTAMPASENMGAYPNGHMMALDLMRKRLDEEKSKHEETVKQVHETASASLRTGLIPIFYALQSFTLDTLKAYEQLRIPNGGGT